MSDEIKYCNFCNKEKPIKEFVKSGFAIKNICRECQNKKQAQIYRDSKKVKELEKENQELKKQLEEHNLAIENLAYWKGKNESKMKINRLRRENQELKEQLERSEKARKEAIEYINRNPLVCVGDYDYFVNDIIQMESFSNKMSFIRTLKELLDIDKGE